MNEIYRDFAVAVFKKLVTEVNGKVVYEIYQAADTVIFKVFFKDFQFGYAFNRISEKMYNGTSSTDECVAEFKAAYKKVIFDAFFKTEERKARDRKKGEEYGNNEA